MRYIVNPDKKDVLGYCFGCSHQSATKCGSQTPEPICDEHGCGKYNT